MFYHHRRHHHHHHHHHHHCYYNYYYCIFFFVIIIIIRFLSQRIMTVAFSYNHVSLLQAPTKLYDLQLAFSFADEVKKVFVLMKSRKRLTLSLVSFPSTFRINNVLLSLYVIQHQKNQPQKVGISSYQISSVSLITHRYALFTILHFSHFFLVLPTFISTTIVKNIL